MFSFKRLWLALPLFGLLASCSEEIEVAAPYKPVTIVYGLLNIADTAHYIRIQKAFMDENRSALDLARNADSSFYTNLEVHFQDFNFVATNENDLNLPASALVADEIMPRVNLNSEGYQKDSGVFFNTPSFAFKSTRQLLSTHTYRVIVRNLETGASDTAQTRIINNNFNEFQIPEFNQGVLNFPAFRSDDVFRFTVTPPANAQMFEGIVRFHYVDKEGQTQTDRTLDYRFATTTRDEGNGPTELSTMQRSFFTFLRDAIGTAPTNVQRYIDSCDLIVWAGGRDLLNYQTINNAQGGITADQIKPIFTNIRGKDVYGLLSTRTSVGRNRIAISDRTLDSLINSASTRPLNFQGRSDH